MYSSEIPQCFHYVALLVLFLQFFLTIYLNSAAAFTPLPFPASSQLFLFLAYDALNVFSFSPLRFLLLLSSSACFRSLVQWADFSFQSGVMIFKILVSVMSLVVTIKPRAARIEHVEGLSISHFSWLQSAGVPVVH